MTQVSAGNQMLGEESTPSPQPLSREGRGALMPSPRGERSFTPSVVCCMAVCLYSLSPRGRGLGRGGEEGRASERDSFPFTDTQVFPDADTWLSLVQGIEVQPWSPGFQQLLAHICDHFLTELADAGSVVAIGFKLLANPARNFSAAHIRETHEA